MSTDPAVHDFGAEEQRAAALAAGAVTKVTQASAAQTAQMFRILIAIPRPSATSAEHRKPSPSPAAPIGAALRPALDGDRLAGARGARFGPGVEAEKVLEVLVGGTVVALLEGLTATRRSATCQRPTAAPFAKRVGRRRQLRQVAQRELHVQVDQLVDQEVVGKGEMSANLEKQRPRRPREVPVG